jgi:hypothetical protein
MIDETTSKRIEQRPLLRDEQAPEDVTIVRNFQKIYTLTVGRLRNQGFELLPTGQRPHFTVRLRHATDLELRRLLAALGDVQPNPQYPRGRI